MGSAPDRHQGDAAWVPPVTPHTASDHKGTEPHGTFREEEGFQEREIKGRMCGRRQEGGEKKTGSADLEMQSGFQIVKSCEGAQLGLFKAKGGDF